MLSAFRDKHIQMVSRYIIIKSQEAKRQKAKEEEEKEKERESRRPSRPEIPIRAKSSAGKPDEKVRKDLRGTGGTALIPFLRQARDETGEPAIDAWARRVLSKGRDQGRHERRNSKIEVQGLASVWHVDDSDGGLCLY